MGRIEENIKNEQASRRQNMPIDVAFNLFNIVVFGEARFPK